MSEFTATYSPEDNKLRLYASSRLDSELCARVKAAGFKWAPKQDLFVAPMWTPDREDFLIDLCGEIDDEDTSLVERQEQRAERFEDYSENRAKDAERAREAVSAIADNIPLGQPILVGHHSERHARRDAKRIENGMRRAVQMWRTSEYWTQRAKGAIRHAKYKERPDVRARRIKGIEVDRRKKIKTRDRSQTLIAMWSKPLETPSKSGVVSPRLRAIALGNLDGSYYNHAHDFRRRDEQGRPSGEIYHNGPLSLWEAAGGNVRDYDPDLAAYVTPEEVRDKAIHNHNVTIAWAQRWIEHYDNRLAYERAMLEESGGTPADQVKPEKGGACRCWASPRGGYSYIQKVNKVSVTVLDNWGRGDEDGSNNFTRTIPFDKLFNLLTARDVESAREDGRLIETQDKTGFHLLDSVPETKPRPQPVKDEKAAEFEKMAETLKAGVQVVTAPQLFPTPRELAERMIEEADIQTGHEVLEPSAGTGNLIGAMGAEWYENGGRLVAVELNIALCNRLRTEFPLTDVRQGDFLECNDDLGGQFDRIVMNPPFQNGADIKHIKHALTLLKPGGRLVALCANGPRQKDALEPLADLWEPLPAGSFSEQGTNVNVALLVIDKPAPREDGCLF